MERSREARRAGTTFSNGMCRRRNRSTSLRDSPEDGQVELQEAVRLRDRVRKEERDRELSNRNKRRRGDRFVQGSNRNEVEESSKESEDNDEDDYQDQDEGHMTRTMPSNQPSSSSSLSNHSHPRKFAPVRIGRSSSIWKSDEVIGVMIPRKARSAWGKRSHDSWVSRGFGFGEEQGHCRSSTSPAARSMDGSPLLSSSVSAKKKRPIGPKTFLPKAPSRLPSSPSVQDDIEIEVAEALYDLMKQSQSQSSKKQDTAIWNSTRKLDLEDKNDNSNMGCSLLAFTQTVSLVSNFSPENNSSSTPLPDPGSKMKRTENAKGENENAIVSIQNGLAPSETKADSAHPKEMETEILSLKLEKKASGGASSDLGTSQTMVVEPEPLQDETVKPQEKFPTPKSKDGVDIVAKEEVAASNDGAPPCAQSVLDVTDLTRRKGSLTKSKVETKREAKFEIDLMAPPPVAASPERDGTTDLVACPEIMTQDVEVKTEIVVKSEHKSEETVKNGIVVGRVDKKMETSYVKQEKLKLDLEKEDQCNGLINCSVGLQPMDSKELRQSKVTIPDGEKSAQTSSSPFPIVVAGWPGSLPLGFMSSVQTIVPVGGTSGSSPALQPPQFIFSQPRPKRCAIHHYIACNIHRHQQFTNTNHIWPAASGAPSAYGSKPYNISVMQSMQKMIHCSPSRGGFPGDKVRGSASGSSLTGKEKSCEVASIVDVTQKKPLVLQQAPQPVSAGNLLHSPAFIFPLSQHQTALGPSVSAEVGLPKPTAVANNGPFPGNSPMGAPVKSSSKTSASTVGFKYASLSGNEAAPFPIANHVGPLPPQRGANAQAMSFFNGSFYPSPAFHPSQDQQQRYWSQTMVQPAHQVTSTSSGASSSHKQSQGQQQQATQVTGNHFLTSTGTQLQQRQKQHALPSHSSRKHEADTTGEANSFTIQNQAKKGACSQNFAVPIQPMNFALMAPLTLGSSGSCGNNHGEKQKNGAEGGVELIPQAFAVSFTSFDGSSSASGHNFSSMTQNPAIFQTLPDMARYQITTAPQVVQQKNEMARDCSINTDDGRKSSLGKSASRFGQSLSFSKLGYTDPSASVIVGSTVYDRSSRTLNFVSPPATGNHSSCSTLTSMTAASVTTIPPNSQQQQQLIQIQKHHMMQQQMHQQQLTGATRIKPPTSNSLPASSVPVKLPNGAPAFSQNHVQTGGSGQSMQWKNTVRTLCPQVPSPSQAAATTSTLKNRPPQQMKTPQGETQISFGGNSNSGTGPQGHQIVINNQTAIPYVGSPPNSSISRNSASSSKTGSVGSKASPAISALSSQQKERVLQTAPVRNPPLYV